MRCLVPEVLMTVFTMVGIMGDNNIDDRYHLCVHITQLAPQQQPPEIRTQEAGMILWT